MKSDGLPKGFPASPEEWEQVIAAAPEQVTDPDCPYDPNDPEQVEAFWKDAVVVREGGPQAVHRALDERRRGQRGSQKTPTKKLVTLRLDQEVMTYFKAQGPGWQTRINEALKRIIATEEAAKGK